MFPLFPLLLLLLRIILLSAVTKAGGGQWQLLQPNIRVGAMQLLYNDRVVFGFSNLSLPKGKCRDDPNEQVVKVDCTVHSLEYDVASNTFRLLFVQTNVWCSSDTVFSRLVAPMTDTKPSGFSTHAPPVTGKNSQMRHSWRIDAILFDYTKGKLVITYPQIPGGDSRSYPSTGYAVLIPLRNLQVLSIEAEVVVCGGASRGSYQVALKVKRSWRSYQEAKRTCARITSRIPTRYLRNVIGGVPSIRRECLICEFFPVTGGAWVENPDGFVSVIGATSLDKTASEEHQTLVWTKRGRKELPPPALVTAKRRMMRKSSSSNRKRGNIVTRWIIKLKDAGAWQYVEQHRHAYFDKMQVWDYTGLGYTRYDARDVNKEVLGCVVENKVLHSALLSCIEDTDFLKTIYPLRLTSKIIAEGIAVGSDIGEVHLLKKYETERKPANVMMMAILESIQKAYSVDFGPLNVLRAAAFHGANNISPLKRSIISYASGQQKMPLFS
ncbi:FAD/NAD(P)-binding oxidoreductase family protein [Senna tora]|uniref:FAD/NAD(P)-binding oxidoreductase family protein n=1 Tax=Senna tora TaxID=362788 RepID=A0A835CE68_9FABA|nr:FAD/NAD(P)-binding oxidoreductase family protein [Senna tora]